MRRLLPNALLAVVASSVLLVSGCVPAVDGSEGSTGQSGSWSAEEVKEATGSRGVVPLFAVPKDIEPLQLAFINPGLGYAFFAEWSAGMNDAAEFYGVQLDESDLAFAYDTALSAYEQVSVKSPVVVGSGGGAFNAAVVEAVTANDAKVVVIDGALDGATDFGVSDAAVGSLAVSTIKDSVDEKLAGDWKDRDLFIVGISAANCAPCDTRVEQSFADAAEIWGIPEDKQIRLEPTGTDPNVAAADTFTDYLTAHPDAVTIVVSYGDDPVIGAVNASKSASRSADILAVASGGAATARAALRGADNEGILVGAVDYQPYAEGWNWVEVAIATYLGEDFAPFEVTRVLTSENVDEFYPDDKE